MTYNLSRLVQRRLDAARGYLMLEMFEQALDELDDIDPPAEAMLDWQLLRGEALRGRQEYRAAIRAYQTAGVISPQQLEVYLGLAWCYKRTDQLAKSIEMMHEAYAHHRDEPIVLYNLACYYALAGNKEQALPWLGRALRMQPDLRSLIATESDFHALRHDPDFVRLIELSEPRAVKG